MTEDRLTNEDQALARLLEEYGDRSMPEPAPGFFDRAMARAVQQGVRRQRRRWVMTGFGGAVAAALALWLVTGVFLSAPQPDNAAVPAVTMALETPRTLNLVFSSATELDEATMTVSLPEGIELQGFPGQREITWMTSLRAGQNVLPLTLVATTPAGGELLATLRQGQDYKTFRLKVTVG